MADGFIGCDRSSPVLSKIITSLGDRPSTYKPVPAFADSNSTCPPGLTRGIDRSCRVARSRTHSRWSLSPDGPEVVSDHTTALASSDSTGRPSEGAFMNLG